jgi:ribonucleotide monophosphatase NagD (HAD superfamily)
MGGKSVGMRTVLTLSGVTRDSDLSRVKPDMQPDLVVQSLTEL